MAPLTNQLTTDLVLEKIGFGEAVRVQSVACVHVDSSDFKGSTYGQSDGQFELFSFILHVPFPPGVGQVVQFKSDGVIAVHTPVHQIIPFAFWPQLFGAD